MISSGLSTAAALLALSSLDLVSAQSSYGSKTTLPVVDLGYQLQQANDFNATGNYYNFSDIRFAAPPTGENRWKVPQHPATNRSTVQKGGDGRMCPQANPAWALIAAQFLPTYLTTGQTQYNASSFNTTISAGAATTSDPGTTEDCLFLDVMVPKTIFDNAGKGYGAPVLVWIYGGGYVAGSKTSNGNPAGLLRRSENNDEQGVIYVAMNYRLGAFGWMSGPTFQENGTANVGLYDQRFALEWVQKNIAKFGGDPKRVTVLGESAGGGSIMHQITAYGGSKGAAPFQQAIVQSPGWLPLVSNAIQEQNFKGYLELLNVSSLEEARKLPYSALQTANIEQVGTAQYGAFIYGPAVDGDFVPAMPGELLLHGQFDKSIRVMAGHNADEGLAFTSPFISNDTAFAAFVEQSLPSIKANPSALEYITKTLYPPIFDGSQAQGYKDQIARAAAFISEGVFTCNTHYLDKAYKNETYAYFFTIPPALHAADIPYTFYDDTGVSTTVLSPKIAIALQEYLTEFAMTGMPNEKGVPYFPIYGSNSTIQNLGVTGIVGQKDPTANARCDWWQKVLYI
ncbi:Hypothetical protein R9X50_00720500 [Acrodontium crateriforme]|uniref:Carboxylic ester hydrolase n=1 Tax=Acrodontium crateriforme TaxID=150365 RepID=A0AAQ3MCP7_9PEZI|nr:Hypothetical protein R9X50_00720500 [Acrodontium crateriforme]